MAVAGDGTEGRSVHTMADTSTTAPTTPMPIHRPAEERATLSFREPSRRDRPERERRGLAGAGTGVSGAAQPTQKRAFSRFSVPQDRHTTPMKRLPPPRNHTRSPEVVPELRGGRTVHRTGGRAAAPGGTEGTMQPSAMRPPQETHDTVPPRTC